jgi:hypothetical protein
VLAAFDSVAGLRIRIQFGDLVVTVSSDDMVVSMSQEVTFRVPDFKDPETGVQYTDTEVIFTGEDLHDVARLAKTVEKSAKPMPVREKK